MSSPEKIPYYPNHYEEKLQLSADAAKLILDTYGKPAASAQGLPIDIARWDDVEIATTYELARFQPQADVNDQCLHQIDFKVTQRYPNGEESIMVRSVNPSTRTHMARRLKLTAAEQAELEDRIAESKERMPDLPEGQRRVLPPRKNDLDPEHVLEFFLSQLARGLEILEQTAAN